MGMGRSRNSFFYIDLQKSVKTDMSTQIEGFPSEYETEEKESLFTIMLHKHPVTDCW